MQKPNKTKPKQPKKSAAVIRCEEDVAKALEHLRNCCGALAIRHIQESNLRAGSNALRQVREIDYIMHGRDDDDD